MGGETGAPWGLEAFLGTFLGLWGWKVLPQEYKLLDKQVQQ